MEKKKCLLIAHDGSPDDWHLQLETVLVNAKFDPPRVHAMLDDEQQRELSKHPMIKLCYCVEPITDEEISDRILKLYGEKNPLADCAADSFLDLMVKVKILEDE